ncbi:MAG: SRPBCC domain-containing protein [Chloroflexi bacterium]|nr:SRPBCC domain-containing protein [Chloroflexota bacterium]
MGTTKIIAEPGIQQVDMEREFDAPRDLLFRAHTDPDLLVQWLGPRDEKMRLERLEARDGGTNRLIFKGSDGNDHGLHGVFHGTPSPEGIVQTFEYEGTPGHVSLDSITFAVRRSRRLTTIGERRGAGRPADMKGPSPAPSPA